MTHLAVGPSLQAAPSHWRRVRFKAIARRREQRRGNSGLPLLSLASSGILFPRDQTTDRQPPSAGSIERYLVAFSADLVVNPMWMPGGAVGVSTLEGAVSPDYRVFELGDGVHPRFVHHLLRSPQYLDQYRLYARADTTFDRRVQQDDLDSLPIAMPPLHEQRMIADELDRVLGAIDGAITLRREQMTLLEARRTGFIDSGILGALGARRSIASLGTYVNGYPFKPTDFGSTGTPVIRIQQLNNPAAEVDLYPGEVPDRHVLRDGDLIFSWSGSLCARIWDRGRAYLNQHLFRVLPSHDVDIQWLSFALDCASRLFERHMHGSGLTHITRPMMKAVELPLPPPHVQRRLAAEIGRVDHVTRTLIVEIAEEVRVLQERKRATHTHAVVGRIGVRARD